MSSVETERVSLTYSLGAMLTSVEFPAFPTSEPFFLSFFSLNLAGLDRITGRLLFRKCEMYTVNCVLEIAANRWRSSV